MPNLYFHVRQGGQIIEDPEGLDLPDLDAAREQAVAAASTIARGAAVAGPAPSRAGSRRPQPTAPLASAELPDPLPAARFSFLGGAPGPLETHRSQRR